MFNLSYCFAENKQEKKDMQWNGMEWMMQFMKKIRIKKLLLKKKNRHISNFLHSH